MLVLTRKAGEQILVGEDIIITVLESRRDGVRIGIQAPRGVRIQRNEIIEAVTEANVAATQADPEAEEPHQGPALPPRTPESGEPEAPGYMRGPPSDDPRLGATLSGGSRIDAAELFFSYAPRGAPRRRKLDQVGSGIRGYAARRPVSKSYRLLSV